MPISSVSQKRQTQASGPLVLFLRTIVPTSCCVRFKKLSSSKRARMTLPTLHDNACAKLALKFGNASACGLRCLWDVREASPPEPSSSRSPADLQKVCCFFGRYEGFVVFGWIHFLLHPGTSDGFIWLSVQQSLRRRSSDRGRSGIMSRSTRFCESGRNQSST